MARGRPALWSAVFGAPLVALGGYLFAFQSQLPLLAGAGHAPPVVGAVLAGFGLFVVGLGCYVEFVAAPSSATMRPGESVVDERDPAQRSALGQAVVSLPCLAGGFYLLYFTDQPYLYPMVPFAVGLYMFSKGLLRYWRNTLTTFFVTNQRVVEEYRFLSLIRNELPLDKVRSVEERRSVWDSLFGLGSVYVRAGSTGGLTVTVGDVYEPTEFADEIRGQLAGGSVTIAAGSDADGAERESADEATSRDNVAAADIAAEMTGSGTDAVADAPEETVASADATAGSPDPAPDGLDFEREAPPDRPTGDGPSDGPQTPNAG